MGSTAQQYSILGVSRFNVYILELQRSTDNTTVQKVFILKCDKIIRDVVLAPASCHGCFAIIACGKTLWRVLLQAEGKNAEDRPAKRKRIDNESTPHEDIFADLLSETEREKQIAEDNHDLFQKDESIQEQVFSLTVTQKDKLCSLDSEILAITASERTLVVLLEDQNTACVKIFSLETQQVKCVYSFSTGLDSSHFYGDCESSCGKPLYLVLEWNSNIKEYRDDREEPTHLITLPKELFASVFGKEAACLRSPAVLLCDTKGCVYFYCIKSLLPDTRRLKTLCEVGSEIVCVSKIELESQPVNGAFKNQDAISLLESALDKVGGEEKTRDKKQSLLITGLGVIGKTGQCYLILPGEVGTDVLAFSLPQSTHSCMLRGNCLYYLTENSVEACYLSLVRQENNCLKVSTIPKFTLLRERCMHLISLAFDENSQEDVILGVSDEFELVHLHPPSSQDKPAQSSLAFNNREQFLQSCVENTLSRDDVKAAQNSIDTWLLQLNLFASILKQKDGDMKGREMVITCECNMKSNFNFHEIYLQIKLNNNTSVSFTKEWKVNVAISQRAQSVSTATNHFTIALPYGLSPKSSKVILVPVTGLPTSNFYPFHMSVSLVLANDLCFESIKRMSSRREKALSVEIHNQVFYALDYLPIVYQTDQGVDVGERPDDLANSLGCNLNPELALRLMSLPRTWREKTRERLVKKSATAATFTLSIGVPDVLCKNLNLHKAGDLVKLLLNQSDFGSSIQENQSQIFVASSCDRVSASLAFSSEPQIKEDFHKRNLGEKFTAYTVKVRSSNLWLLMAIRESVVAKLEHKKNFISRNADETFPTSSVKRTQLRKFERLAEKLEATQAQVKFTGKEWNFFEISSTVCDLFDKYALIY